MLVIPSARVTIETRSAMLPPSECRRAGLARVRLHAWAHPPLAVQDDNRADYQPSENPTPAGPPFAPGMLTKHDGVRARVTLNGTIPSYRLSEPRRVLRRAHCVSEAVEAVFA